MSLSLSVPLPRRRCSRISTDGGWRKRNLGLRSVFLICLTPCIQSVHTPRSCDRTHLHLDVQDTGLSTCCHILDSLNACAIQVASKLCMLNEAILLDELFELVSCHKVVLLAILLSASRCSCSVRDGEAKSIWILLEQSAEQSRLASS